MAKKNKKPNLPEETLARARAELYGKQTLSTEKPSSPQTTMTKASKAKATMAKPTASKNIAITVDDLRAEYVYVISDLQSMAILAGILFIGLIVASLIFV